jgi:hypothetical protein
VPPGHPEPRQNVPCVRFNKSHRERQRGVHHMFRFCQTGVTSEPMVLAFVQTPRRVRNPCLEFSPSTRSPLEDALCPRVFDDASADLPLTRTRGWAGWESEPLAELPSSIVQLRPELLPSPLVFASSRKEHPDVHRIPEVQPEPQAKHH